MHVAIATRNVAIPEEIRAVVEEKVSRLGRFLEGMEVAEIRFREERNPRISEREVCEVTMHGHGHIVRARAAATEPLAAVDKVIDKLEHRMEKLKGKLVARSHPRRNGHGNGHANGKSGVSTIDQDEEGDSVHFAAPDVDDGSEGPRIVKTKQFAIKPMTPEEGALQMDLLGHDFFLFTNGDTGRAAVVYRRADGDIGLIDT